MGNNPSFFKGDNLPVEWVCWDDCQKFIEKLNKLTGKKYRLPTEAEWEYAARGGNKSKGYRYAGSDDIAAVAWYNGNSNKQTHPAGEKLPNELGLYDMNGNVWEWCGDWYDDDYYKKSPKENPKGPAEGNSRVLRGGGWSDYFNLCRLAYRFYINAGVFPAHRAGAWQGISNFRRRRRPSIHLPSGIFLPWEVEKVNEGLGQTIIPVSFIEKFLVKAY